MPTSNEAQLLFENHEDEQSTRAGVGAGAGAGTYHEILMAESLFKHRMG